MKKIFRLFLILTVLSGVVFTTSCEKEEAPVGHTHDYAIKVVAPKCEDDGYTEYVCRDCGYEYHDTIVPAKGHDFDFYLSESLNLETEVGEDVYMCSDCEKKEYTLVSHVNTKDKGVKDFYLGTNKYNVSTTDGYTNSYFQLTVSDIDIHDTGSLYYTFNADDGLFYHRAFRLDFSGNGQAVTYAYENGGYPSSVINMATCKMDAKNNEITFKFEYDKHNIKKSEAVGNFAFYLVIDSRDVKYEYKNINPYVVPSLSETWIKVNSQNRFYYETKYQNFVCEDWKRPSITKADINWTHICRAETPEEAIVSTLIAEEKGATNVDFNLLTLKPIYRNYDDMSKIFKTFKNIGTIAVYYNSDVTQEERLRVLKLAVQAGCGGIDLQGFMFHTGSTKTTHTEENIKYWEDRGFDMSFIDASPAETTIDPEEDAKQIEFINEIHALGGMVLGSQHVSAQFTRSQAVAYAKFLDHRGLDIIKVVSHAKNLEILEGTILANRDVYHDETINGKFSIHTNNAAYSDISRVLGPLFYHCYMSFNYNYLCKLDMMMDLLHSGIPLDDSISVKDAIELIKGKSEEPELQYLIDQYNTIEKNSCYALGAGSDMSDRWSFTNEDASLKLRSATGTNSFSIRGAGYSALNYSNNFEYETTITGNFKPYTSSSRLPKFGIFLGDQEHMLALTYNFETTSGVGKKYSVGLMTNSYFFGYDTQTKDALDTNIITPIDVNSNVVDGDSLRIKVKYTNGDLSIYYSESLTGDYTLIQELKYEDIKDYFTHDENRNTYFGNVVEVYLGSASVGMDNIVYFNNTINYK